jgi:hypothetical protein
MYHTYEKVQMDLTPQPFDEKAAAEIDDLIQSTEFLARVGNGRRCSCATFRRRVDRRRCIAITFGIIIAIFLLAALFVYFCPVGYSDSLPMALLKRQQDMNNGNGSGNAFIDQRLWIIIVCVVGIGSPETFH